MTRERVQYTLRRWLPLLIALGVILVLLFAWNRSRMMMHRGAYFQQQQPNAAQQAPGYGPRARGNEQGNFFQNAPVPPQDRRESFRQFREQRGGFQPFGFVRRILFGAPNQIFTLALLAGVAWLLIRRRRQMEAQPVTPAGTPPNDQNPPVV